MNTLFIARCVVTCLCLLIAGAMAFFRKDGWGWFIFAGIICLPLMGETP